MKKLILFLCIICVYSGCNKPTDEFSRQDFIETNFQNLTEAFVLASPEIKSLLWKDKISQIKDEIGPGHRFNSYLNQLENIISPDLYANPNAYKEVSTRNILIEVTKNVPEKEIFSMLHTLLDYKYNPSNWIEFIFCEACVEDLIDPDKINFEIPDEIITRGGGCNCRTWCGLEDDCNNTESCTSVIGCSIILILPCTGVCQPPPDIE